MRKFLFVLLLAAAQLCGAQTLIFSHDFENNSLDPASGVVIGSGDRVGPPVVSTTRANGGTHSALMNMGNTSLGYVLTTTYASVTVQWDMYIPSNYKAAKVCPYDPVTGGPNNKIFRIYSSTGYGSSEKVGFSTEENKDDCSFEEVVPEWGAPGGNLGAIGPQGTGSQNFILSGDQGTWVTYRAYYAPPTAAGAGNYGTLKLWKNGTLIVNETGTVNNYDPADAGGVLEFYILGAANTDFSPAVDFYIDNVSAWSGEYTGASNTISGAIVDTSTNTLAGSGTLAIAGSGAIVDSSATVAAGAGTLAITGVGAIVDNVPAALSGSMSSGGPAVNRPRRRAGFRHGFGF